LKIIWTKALHLWWFCRLCCSPWWR